MFVFCHHGSSIKNAIEILFPANFRNIFLKKNNQIFSFCHIRSLFKEESEILFSSKNIYLFIHQYLYCPLQSNPLRYNTLIPALFRILEALLMSTFGIVLSYSSDAVFISSIVVYLRPFMGLFSIISSSTIRLKAPWSVPCSRKSSCHLVCGLPTFLLLQVCNLIVFG